MAANNRRRKYSSSGPVDGNLARKLNQQQLSTRELERQLDRSGRMDFDQLYERQPETAAERNARLRAQMKAAVRPAQKVSPMALLGFVCVAFLMVVLVLCYVRLNTISRSIVAMKTEISQLEVEQVGLRAQYEQTFDPAAVKEAASAAGMSQPSDSQVYYISLPGEDRATAYRARGNSGLLDRFFSAISQGISTVAEYFR